MTRRSTAAPAPAPTIPKIPPTQVLSRLAALETAPTATLKDQWRELFGKEPPPWNRAYIQSRLAYRIQELAYDGLKPETVDRLVALGEQLDGGNVVLRRIRADSRPLAGTRLIREWQGVQHVVTVRVNDFEFEGRPYQSLSAIARHITGTRWNGWTFFGLRARGEALRVRRVFEIFAETGSGIETVARLRAEGATSKAGRPLNKGDVYKLLNNRTYVGEAAHKGLVYPGEHQGIVPRELWDRAHAVLQVSPRVRANQNRAQTPALLKGLIFGVDGRALSPTHARKNGRLYRYYVAQRVLKGDAAGDATIVRRVSAAEIEAAVEDQVRALLRQPEIVVGTWRAARKEAPDLTERETHDALHRLDPLWEHLFPAEQARIVRSLVERVVVGPAGADIRLRLDGLGGLVRDLTAIPPAALRAAA